MGRPSGNLPAEVTSFVGRRNEVSEARRLLTQTRLLTLAGPGGVGKTRLGLTVAGQLRRAFPDGVWLVDLAPLADPELLPVAVADALGVRDESGRPLPDVLRAHIADKSLLVVLDNCEHLLEACAELAVTLLRAAPGVRMVATSREPLRVDGEHVFTVPPLAMPEDPDAPSREVMATEAVTLLAERAEAAVPSFTMRPEDAPTAARIVRALDGLPLAIELAAVQLRALSLEQLLERIDDALGLLAGGMRSGLPRQRTLRAMIDWSFDLCSPEERTLWERLSVFAASFDLDTMERVCGGEGLAGEAVDLIVGLVDKSIVQREQHGDAVRYRLLETIRQYGRERLAASGTETELRRRHRDWYQGLAARLDAEWYGPHQLDWFRRMRTEHADVRAALDFCLAHPDEAATGLTIACELRVYWHASGSLAEGRHWVRLLLDRHPEPDAVRARGLRTAGLLALYHNDLGGALVATREARELALRLDNPVLIAWSTLAAGFATLLGQDIRTAVPLLEDAVARMRATRDNGGILLSLMVLANALLLLGDEDRAVLLGREAVTFSKSIGESWMRAWLMWVLGIVAWRQGDLRRAAEYERDGIRLKRAFQDGAGIGQCSAVLGWIAAAEGRPERGARLLGAADAVWRRTGSSLYRHLVDLNEKVVAELRSTLGDDGFDAAFAEGTRLTLDEAVCYALEERTRSRPRGAERAQDTLTRRETQIAELIAEGLTNKEIAARLVISQRTVETHVEHILTKLGFSSRTQVASWFTGERSA
ncbi:ATP-binding protein [Gandjariella thermophila]|nr:LuxR C-terminal-related transcriptional regulator [Gandjariella thermophila]